MPRARRPENRGLPARWQFAHGAYYFRVPPGLEGQWDGKRRFRLGATLPEAYSKWAERVGRPDRCASVGALLDRYALEVVPTKAPKTRVENARQIGRLRKVFGHMPLGALKPRHVYEYVDRRGRKVAAHREVEVLSHAFTKAVEWGCMDRHPFKGQVRLEGEPPRTRYVHDWEVDEALKLAPRRKAGSVLMVQAYICLKLLTGLARSDLLRLEPARHFTDEGIDVTRHKTARKTGGKRTIYLWTPELRRAVDLALAARPVDIAPFLFCNRRGEGYIDEATGSANGFDSIWGRFVDRVLAETKVRERFTEHDLRAKVGSDAESLERARALLQHVDSRVTAKVYRRAPERVLPGKGV